MNCHNERWSDEQYRDTSVHLVPSDNFRFHDVVET